MLFGEFLYSLILVHIVGDQLSMKSKSHHEQVCVLVARGRPKNTFVGLLGCGRITKKQLDKVIGDKLNP